MRHAGTWGNRAESVLAKTEKREKETAKSMMIKANDGNKRAMEGVRIEVDDSDQRRQEQANSSEGQKQRRVSLLIPTNRSGVNVCCARVGWN